MVGVLSKSWNKDLALHEQPMVTSCKPAEVARLIEPHQ